MALVVIGLGVAVAMFFQVFVHENPDAHPLKLKWYKWLSRPQLYLVWSHTAECSFSVQKAEEYHQLRPILSINAVFISMMANSL